MRARTLIALLVLTPLSAANTIFVDAGLASGANNGLTWADAYQGTTGLQTALAASAAGDQIWVRAGVYEPTLTTTRTISFQLKTGVEIYGGFLGTETSPAERPPFGTAQSFLLGDLNGDDGSANYADNSIHVVDASGTNATAVLDGFTIAGGNANQSGANQDRGGGILCVAGASPTVRNCRFLFNRCTFGGGAGYAISSSPTFTDCRFESNVAGSSGGAFYVEPGGGVLDWNRCVFSRNTAARGGALEILTGGGAGSIRNCSFVDNVATGAGGGALYISAAGFAPWAVWNCTFVGNSATAGEAGGILTSFADPSIYNCIFWINAGAGGAMGAINQISANTLGVYFSCVMGGWPGSGNIASDPQFANLAARDLTLTITSPCIDAGHNSYAYGALDLAGNPRFADEPTVPDTGFNGPPIVDLGAYEFPAPVVHSFCAGDSTGTPCPCGNNAPFVSGRGCLNSLGTGGWLTGSGSARVTADTFVLLGTGMTNATCLYFQGTAMVNGYSGSAFGDGLRCVDGTVVRLGTKTNANGASQYPDAGDPSVSVRGSVTSVGTVRLYQVWYRDQAAFCQPETFNLTNALTVTWAQ